MTKAVLVVRDRNGRERLRTPVLANADGAFCTRDLYCSDLQVGDTLTIEDEYGNYGRTPCCSDDDCDGA